MSKRNAKDDALDKIDALIQDARAALNLVELQIVDKNYVGMVNVLLQTARTLADAAWYADLLALLTD